MTSAPIPPPLTQDPQACLASARGLGVPFDYGRKRGLRLVREPKRLVLISIDAQQRAHWLAPPAAAAWKKLLIDAQNENIELQIVSAYRSIEYQLAILKRKIDQGQRLDDILKVNAAPGYSEHHSGRALDVSTPGYPPLQEEFEQSSAFAWLNANAPRYGFHLSFPRHNMHGIAYEPWHWCWRR